MNPLSIRGGLRSLIRAVGFAPPSGERALYPKSDGWYDQDSATSEKKLSDKSDTSGVPAYGLPASGSPANRYDGLRGIYNYKSSNTRILEQGLSRAMAGGVSTHLIIGDSGSNGTIAQVGSAWIFDRLRAWPLAMRDQLAVGGVPSNGTGLIRHTDGTAGGDTRWVTTGTWTGYSWGAGTVVVSSSATLTPDRDGTCFDYLYANNGGGTFTISVDGTVLKTVATTGATTWAIARLTGLNVVAGVTQIKITLTVAGASGIFVAGGSVWSPAAGLIVHNVAQAGSSASGTGVGAWVDVSASNVLGTVYLDFAGRKRTVTDGVSTAGSSTFASATGAFTVDDVGKTFAQVPSASGPMFSCECYFGAFIDSTHMTIYAGATIPGVCVAGTPILASNTTSAQTVVIGRDPDCVHIALGANDMAGLAASDATIVAAITTIRNRYPNSDCILHLQHEVSTTLVSTVRYGTFQKAMYKLADDLDVSLYDWRDRVGTFAAGQANGSYGDNVAHINPATESDLGSQLAWIMGGGSGRPQANSAPVLPADLANKRYVDGKSVFAASVSTPGAGYSSDTYVVGSACAIPLGRLKAQTQYRCKIFVSKTGAGIATPIITLRMGILGTTGDAAITTLTFAAQTGVIDSGFIEVFVSFRTIGSGTTAVVAAGGTLTHQLAATGLANVAVSAPTNVSAGFDSTTKTIIGVSLNAGASAAWTTPVVQAELFNLV